MTLTVCPNIEIIAERSEVSELVLSRTAIPTGVQLRDVREVKCSVSVGLQLWKTSVGQTGVRIPVPDRSTGRIGVDIASQRDRHSFDHWVSEAGLSCDRKCWHIFGASIERWMCARVAQNAREWTQRSINLNAIEKAKLKLNCWRKGINLFSSVIEFRGVLIDFSSELDSRASTHARDRLKKYNQLSIRFCAKAIDLCFLLAFCYFIVFSLDPKLMITQEFYAIGINHAMEEIQRRDKASIAKRGHRMCWVESKNQSNTLN